MQIRTTLIILTLLSTLPSLSYQIDCNSTHFEYFSNYSLGKQQQLNRTFDQIEPMIRVPNVTYKSTDYSTWTLSNIVTKFKYLDSKQKAVVIGRDTVAVYGGFLEVTSQFKWEKSNMMGTINGTAQAKILSGEVMFEKMLQVDQRGYLDYKLAFYYNVSFQFTNYTLTRIDPSTTLATDIANIMNALNVDKQSESARMALQRQISQFFSKYLATNLKDEHFPLDNHFDYTWTNPWSKKSITIPFMLIPTGSDLQPTGLSLTFVSYIKDDTRWKCGKAVPAQELNPKVYGGLQEFIEFSVFSNTIRYAFQQGMLDTELYRTPWQSKVFQFFAGDLYEVIPEVANNFYATQSVTGLCKYNPQQEVVVLKHNTTVLNTTTLHTCSLSIQSTKIAEFDVKLTLQVDVLSNETNLNFRIIHSDASVVFKSVPNFQLKNRELAQHMINHSLNRMKEGYTFGSGWKIYPRDYSHVMMADDHIVIYDSTHIEGSKLATEQAVF